MGLRCNAGDTKRSEQAGRAGPPPVPNAWWAE